MTNKELLEKYPFLRRRDYWTDEPVTGDEFTELDDLPSGWREAFGLQMVEELNEILKKANYVDEYRIQQIKEKFGGLRWYANDVPREIYVEYLAWEDKYYELSTRTCIRCGKPATKISAGWISPFCDDCAEKIGLSNINFVNIDEFYDSRK